MSEKEEVLSRKDIQLLGEYLRHLSAMPKDVETETDVLKELDWLVKNGFAKEIKKGVYGRTRDGKALDRIIKLIGKREVSK